jgi:hypothetical protein
MEDTHLFQMYDTDAWGTHSSRQNLGVFTNIHEALKSLCDNPDRLISYFKKDGRLFIERIKTNQFDGYEQVFDSNFDSQMNELKRVVFCESVQRFSDDLGFLDIDTETDVDFDINSIKTPEDVSDDLIQEYLNEFNAAHFIEISFE